MSASDLPKSFKALLTTESHGEVGRLTFHKDQRADSLSFRFVNDTSDDVPEGPAFLRTISGTEYPVVISKGEFDYRATPD